MGQNSKARRDAKAKARRKAQRTAAGGSSAPHVHFPSEEFLPPIGDARSVAQMFRRECSECGSVDLEWMSPTELAERDGGKRRDRVAEILAFLDGASDAWLCRSCGNYGVM